MKKRTAKLLSVLLLLSAVIVTQIPVSDVEAQTATSDFQMEGSTLLKYTGTAEVVSVPDEVKEIGAEAFAGNDSVIKISVNNEKTEKIGYRAFADCPNLRTIDIGDSVSEIASAAFSNNGELINVDLGSQVRTLGNGVFAGSGQLKRVSLSEDNSYLSYMDGVLYDDELKVLYALMPASEKEAFTLPGTVEEIKAYAFWGNPSLERVTLGSGLREIPAYAFSNCVNLKEAEIPLPVRSIEAKAFEDCANLKSVTLPDSITRIQETAFDGCPQVEITATEGTYGADFAKSMKPTEAEKTEYEDIQDSEVITPKEENQEEAAEGNEATPSPENQVPQEIQEYSGSYSSANLLGQSSIVAGRAVIFIDNGRSGVQSGKLPVAKVDLSDADNAITENLNGLLREGTKKGNDFPKYMVVGDRIASQAYYQDTALTEYEIPEGTKEIGDFAFARSALTSVFIPEGVEKIGYGAFYHCDSLTEAAIPDSVKEIAPNAFLHTPWLENARTADYPFLIAGDGILIYYGGTDSVVNIPQGVKQIGAGVFREHMGITAVNIPESVEIIGEEAFAGCRNLKTVNGAESLVKVKDRAFKDCPLSRIVIPETMEEIGLGAYALSNGTDTVTFRGTKLPALSNEQTAERLTNSDYRIPPFMNIKTAIIPNETADFTNTVLDKGVYGFEGNIYNESGALLADNTGGGKQPEGAGVTLDINSSIFADDAENAMAAIPGNEEAYLLKLRDSEEAASKITAAYGEIYGGREPAGLLAFDMSLYDAGGMVPINKLGRQYITVLLKKPAGVSEDGMHLVTLDSDGQLEAVDWRIVTLEDGDYIQFTTSHFSPFGIYTYHDIYGQAAVQDGKAVISHLPGNRDASPDTGDAIHPKWFLAVGLTAAAIALFFYKGKKNKKAVG